MANTPLPAESVTTKACPFCKMTDVPSAATRCPHCAGDIGQHEMLHSKVCFVATATLGSPDHPDVVVLRRFRDSALLPYRTGRIIICTYYRIGPIAATAIANSERLRRLAHDLIVRPLAKFARRKLGGA